MISNLRPFKFVQINHADGNSVSEDDQLKIIDRDIFGSIVIEQSSKMIWSAKMTLLDESRVWMNADPRVPTSTGKRFSIWGKNIDIYAGYVHSSTDKKLMKPLLSGQVVRINPVFSDDGLPKVQLQIFNGMWNLHKRRRTVTYPNQIARKEERVDWSTGRALITRDKYREDDRSFANKFPIRLSEIINGILIAHGYQQENILIDLSGDDPHYDGKETIVRQVDETDWEFLVGLANSYGLEIIDDNESDRIIVARKRNFDKEIDDRIKFVYHHKHGKKISLEEFDPSKPNTLLPINSINLSLDHTVPQGFITKSFDLKGNNIFVIQDNEDPGLVWEISEEKIRANPDLANEFVSKYPSNIENTRWEDVVVFWRSHATSRKYDPTARTRRFYGDGHVLSFRCPASPYVTVGKRYKVDGIDPWTPERGWYCNEITHTIGDSYFMDVKLTM